MTENATPRPFECAVARRTLDLRFDGDQPDDHARAQLASHLDGCESCRQLRDELDEVQRRLREMPPLAFPDEALHAVWERTSRAPHARTMRWFDWRAAAAAVVLALGLGVIVFDGMPGVEPQPTEAELQQAARESLLVLRLTSRALRRTESVALRDVLAHDVSGALRRVPIDWPAAAGAAGTDRGVRP